MSMQLRRPKSAAKKVGKSSRPKKLARKLLPESPQVVLDVDDEKENERVKEKLLEASADPTPPKKSPSPVGKCSAMGDECGHPTLQRFRHFCVQCGDGVHAIEPCGFELEEGGVACGNCYIEMKPVSSNKKFEPFTQLSEKEEQSDESDEEDVEKFDCITVKKKTRNSNGRAVTESLKLIVGSCPAMGTYCLCKDERWGDVHCDECGLPVHRSPLCLTVNNGKKF